jgi:hypothetical protein
MIEANVTQIVTAEFFRPSRRDRKRDRLPGKQARSKNSRQLQSAHHWPFPMLAVASSGFCACVL